MRRFDEVLCEKAEKHAIELIESKFKLYCTQSEFKVYEELHKELQSQVSSNLDLVYDLQDSTKEELERYFKELNGKSEKNIAKHIIDLFGGKPIGKEEFKKFLDLKVHD